jgi:hypothetical protein
MFPPIRARRRSRTTKNQAIRRSRTTKNQARRRSRTTKNQARRRSRTTRILGQKTRKQHVQHGGVLRPPLPPPLPPSPPPLHTEESDESDDEEDQELEDCSICFAGLVPNAIGQLKIIRLQCGHKFHDKCIRTWFFEGKGKGCPICRNVINPNDLGIKPEQIKPEQTEKERELATAVTNRQRQRNRLIEGM